MDPDDVCIDQTMKEGTAMQEVYGSSDIVSGGDFTATVVYVFDNNYAAIGGTSITSLFENNKDIPGIDVYIFSDGFSDENRGKLSKLAEEYGRTIEIVDISDKFAEYERLGLKPYRGSYIPYVKVFFPHYLSDSIEKMLYIDADTVVLGSIRPLFDTEGLIGMVGGSLVARTGNAAGYDAPYNSEVIFYNAARWRNEGWMDKVIDVAQKTTKHYLGADEGILNLVYKDEIVKLPLQYAFDPIYCAIPKDDYLAVTPDLFFPSEEIAKAYEKPVIIHMAIFLGQKPWELGSVHPAKKYFDEWLSRSLWSDYERKPGKNSLLYSLEIWMYKHLPKRWFYRIWIISQYYYAKNAVKMGNTD